MTYAFLIRISSHLADYNLYSDWRIYVNNLSLLLIPQNDDHPMVLRDVVAATMILHREPLAAVPA